VAPKHSAEEGLEKAVDFEVGIDFLGGFFEEIDKGGVFDEASLEFGLAVACVVFDGLAVFFEEVDLLQVVLGAAFGRDGLDTRAVRQNGDGGGHDLHAEQAGDRVGAGAVGGQVEGDDGPGHLAADDDVRGGGDHACDEGGDNALVIGHEADGDKEHGVEHHGPAGCVLADDGLSEQNGQDEQRPDGRAAKPAKGGFPV